MALRYIKKIILQSYKGQQILAIMISVLILQVLFVSSATASPSVHRIAGYTQYDTAAAIAKEGWVQSDYAILAYGGNFPDALAAAPLAGKYNAPVLLTEAASLTPITKQTLLELKVKSVFIVGGNAVVSQTVANQIDEMGINVTRLAGHDKYDTAIVIAKQIGMGQGITVVTGDDFADALSISAVSALSNYPIILAPKNYLPESIQQYLSSNTISRTFLIGSLDQISESVSSQFPNVERITGNDKYTRNLAVLKRFDSNLEFSTIFLATGNGFADALAGSAYAARTKAPILLVDNVINYDIVSYLNAKYSLTKQLNILGGEAVMPSTIVQKYANPSTDGSMSNVIYRPSEIANRVSPSVVYIEASDSNGIPITSGSGFILDSTGKIATNYHVVKGAYSAKVKTHAGTWYDVSKVFAVDSTQDLALIKIDATNLYPVSLGDSDKIGTGDKIYTIGNPLGLSDTMSDGIISSKSRVVDGVSYIQISAPLSSGSSGGVLLNEQAEVIGITTTGMTDGQNLNFAIPINLLKPTLTQDINLTLAQLPHGSITSKEEAKMTDEQFEAFLNSQYSTLTMAGKSIRFTWKVNDYKTGLSKVSIHGLIDSLDFGNWMELLKTNHKGDLMLYFANLNNEIATNYPGNSFYGSVLYQDYYNVLPAIQFAADEVSYSGGKWLLSHPVVIFYDSYNFNKSEAKVNITD